MKLKKRSRGKVANYCAIQMIPKERLNNGRRNDGCDDKEVNKSTQLVVFFGGAKRVRRPIRTGSVMP
jgi:hypothetical protein